jgi:hypothetical protein
MSGMHLISAHLLHSVWKLRLYRTWNKGMDIKPEEKTSYNTQFNEEFQKKVENNHCAKYRQISVIEPDNVLRSNLYLYAKDSEFGQSACDIYDLSSNDEECLMPKCVAEMTPGRTDHIAY